MEKIKSFFKNLLGKVFEHFFLIVSVALVVAIADLIAIPYDLGLGFILAVLYFVGWILYKTTGKKKPVMNEGGVMEEPAGNQNDNTII